MALHICEDRQKILDASGHILVTGGPGSGKTTIALKKAICRIEQGLEPGQKILFLSFSRAAVTRIIESAIEWVPKESRPKLIVHTFHSFFWQIIKTHAYLLNTPRKMRILLPHDEKVRNGGLNVGDQDWPKWEEEREKLCHNEGLLTFDLFSPKTLEILSQSNLISKIISNCYPLIIVDEAQDTDNYQWECIQQLSVYCRLVCLADLEQQIYDFRPGVSTERVNQIMSQLSPLRIDLVNQNHRSPNVEIVQFGNDILLNSPLKSSYKGVSFIKFKPNVDKRNSKIRQAIGYISKTIENQTGQKPHNIAFLASWGRGVTVISDALRGAEEKKEIYHRILFDETAALLSSRIVAYLLEPKQETSQLINLSIILALLSDFYKAKGTKTGLQKANGLTKASLKALTGQMPRQTKLIKGVIAIFQQMNEEYLTGNPKADWLNVRSLLRNSKIRDLQTVDNAVQYLMAFNRGKVISGGLVEAWQEYGQYHEARVVIDKALTEEQLISDNNDSSGIHVMTMHKAKGKEFDGVIILDESRISPLVHNKEDSPYIRSRKLLRVGITRAKSHVLLLIEAYNPTITKLIKSKDS